MIFLLFGTGLVLIIRGGDRFVASASTIARLSGIPPFVIGATVVSVATTLPEMLVSVTAAASGQSDMAVGNAVGSVTANTALILGLTLLIAPAEAQSGYKLKSLILFAAIMMLWVFSLGGELTVIGSAVMLAAFIGYTILTVREAKAQRITASADQSPDRSQGIKSTVSFVLGAAAIIIGSRLLVDNGTVIARDIMHVDERVISLTMLAVGTSLPELVTAVSAIAKGQSALTAGNILGANIIDTLLILPICCFTSGGSLPVSSGTITTDLPVCMLAALITLLPMIVRGRFFRLQGAAAVGLYILYIIKITFAIVF